MYTFFHSPASQRKKLFSIVFHYKKNKRIFTEETQDKIVKIFAYYLKLRLHSPLQDALI